MEVDLLRFTDGTIIVGREDDPVIQEYCSKYKMLPSEIVGAQIS